MLQVASFLRSVDIQSMLLVCKDWQEGFASSLLKLKPRVLKTSEVASRSNSYAEPCADLSQREACVGLYQKSAFVSNTLA